MTNELEDLLAGLSKDELTTLRDVFASSLGEIAKKRSGAETAAKKTLTLADVSAEEEEVIREVLEAYRAPVQEETIWPGQNDAPCEVSIPGLPQTIIAGGKNV